MSKTYTFDIQGLAVLVEADKDGDARYMVSMALPGQARIRIGYLTGAGRKWVAEFFGKRPDVYASSAKAACKVLAEWAMIRFSI